MNAHLELRGSLRDDVLAMLAILPLLAYFIALPFLSSLVSWRISWTGITLYDTQRIWQLAATCIVVIAMLLMGWRKRLSRFGGSALALLPLMAAIGIASALVNNVPWWDALRELELQLLSLLAFWSVWSAFSTARQRWIQDVAACCLCGSAMLYVAAFLQANRWQLFTSEFSGEPVAFTGFSNVRFFSDYQVLVLPFLIQVVATFCRGRIAKLAGWSWVFFFCMIFFYSGSRAVVLGQMGMHVLMLALLGRRYLPTLRLHGMAWLGGYLFFVFFATVLPYIHAGRSADVLPLLRSGTSLRDIVWGIAIESMIQHPWLGIGPGELARHLNPVAAAPHNSVLMFAAEWGLPFVVIALLLFGGVFVRSLNELRERSDVSSPSSRFAINCWLAAGALLFHSLVANVVVVPASQAALVLATGMACGATVDDKLAGLASGARISALMQRLALYFVAPIVVIAMMVILYRDIPGLPARNAFYFACRQPTPFFSPRFWQQGWLIDGCPDASVGIVIGDKVTEP